MSCLCAGGGSSGGACVHFDASEILRPMFKMQ